MQLRRLGRLRPCPARLQLLLPGDGRGRRLRGAPLPRRRRSADGLRRARRSRLVARRPRAGHRRPRSRGAPRLAAAWTADALLEHASIAAFSRFSLDLLAVGAPAELVIAAHQAALDEVRHARICFALAQGYAGAPIGPSTFPFDGAITVNTDLVALAVSTAREGAIGETLAAAVAAEQLARAVHPAVRRALSAIAEDEARHAELAWRTLAWAIKRGGEPVRAAVAAVFAEAQRHVPSVAADTGIPPGILAPHGRLDAATTREALARTYEEVVYPCFASLLHEASTEDEVVASAAA